VSASPGAARPRVARGFDRLAPIYDAATRLLLADRVHQSQVALLGELQPARRALLVGGGSGRFLGGLLAARLACDVLVLDVSRKMLERSRSAAERRAPARRPELRLGGLERLGTDERFDLVVTHCFLDLFDEPELGGVLARLDAALEPGGRWLFSDFAAFGSGAAQRAAQRALIASLYLFFRAACGIKARRLPDFDAGFARLGYRTVVERRLAGGLLRSAILVKPQAPPE
jgi:ubiquinone/menaquinone biosynthesis C-methylase UbiE